MNHLQALKQLVEEARVHFESFPGGRDAAAKTARERHIKRLLREAQSLAINTNIKVRLLKK